MNETWCHPYLVAGGKLTCYRLLDHLLHSPVRMTLFVPPVGGLLLDYSQVALWSRYAGQSTSVDGLAHGSFRSISKPQQGLTRCGDRWRQMETISCFSLSFHSFLFFPLLTKRIKLGPELWGVNQNRLGRTNKVNPEIDPSGQSYCREIRGH